MNRRVIANGIKFDGRTNVNYGIITAVYQLRKNNVPIKRIAKDLQIGLGTVYKILDKVAWRKKKRAIIDEMIRIFMEDDDFDIYMKEQIEKGKLKHQSNNLD